MKTYRNIYSQICDFSNIFLAWQKARKGKTRKPDIIEFEKGLEKNLLDLQHELKSQAYKPLPLETFPIKDPKTRKISKSDFRDRIIHHAIINIIGPVFEKSFIYDSCANQRGKGSSLAIKRLEKFAYKISRNGEINGRFTANQVRGHYLRADIKHYFQEVNHKILLRIIKRKISNEKTIWLIKQILNANFRIQRERE